MRHRLVHHYEGVDWNVVEAILRDDIPDARGKPRPGDGGPRNRSAGGVARKPVS